MQICGKLTWEGCSKHKDMLMSKVLENERCTCKRDDKLVANILQTSNSNEDHENDIKIDSEEKFDEMISKEENLVVVDFFAT